MRLDDDYIELAVQVNTQYDRVVMRFYPIEPTGLVIAFDVGYERWLSRRWVCLSEPEFRALLTEHQMHQLLDGERAWVGHDLQDDCYSLV